MNPETKKQKTAANSSSSISKPAIVQLNVGGQYFSTTRATLLQSASIYFSRLLGEEDEFNVNMTGAQCDEQGHIFIDHDPALFCQILNSLCNLDNFHVDSLTLQEQDKLHKDALYYQLDGLVSMTRPPLTGYDGSK
jgi:hypothetical protein